MHQHLNPPSLKILLLPVAIIAVFLILKLIQTLSGGAKFKLKSPLLSAPEQSLYHRLTEALPDHIVLAQVAFSQMVYVTGGNSDENFAKRGTAKQKVADFVICDRSFKVIAVVELDDSTHSHAKDAKRDEIIREAGSRTIRWRVNGLPTANDIKRQVLG